MKIIRKIRLKIYDKFCKNKIFRFTWFNLKIFLIFLIIFMSYFGCTNGFVGPGMSYWLWLPCVIKQLVRIAVTLPLLTVEFYLLLISVIKFFYRSRLSALNPTLNQEGQWFSVGVYLSLAHRFRLFRGTGYPPLVAITRLPKHSQELRWRGRVTCNFSSRAYGLTVGIARHLWREHWWHLLTLPRSVTIVFAPLLNISSKVKKQNLYNSNFSKKTAFLRLFSGLIVIE